MAKVFDVIFSSLRCSVFFSFPSTNFCVKNFSAKIFISLNTCIAGEQVFFAFSPKLRIRLDMKEAHVKYFNVIYTPDIS